MPDTSAISPVTVSLNGGLILDRDDFSMPPGAAVELQNFEPSIQGGYRRLTGSAKFDSNLVDGSNTILGVKIFNNGVVAAAGNVHELLLAVINLMILIFLIPIKLLWLMMLIKQLRLMDQRILF